MLRFEISPNFKAHADSVAAGPPYRARRENQPNYVTLRAPFRFRLAFFAVFLIGAPFIAWKTQGPEDANREVAAAVLKAPALLARAALRADPRIARDGVDYTPTSATQAASEPPPCLLVATNNCAPLLRATSPDKFLSKVKSALRSTAR